MHGIPSSPEFQRLFNGYYRIRRNAEWRLVYYALFAKAREEHYTFAQILSALYDETGNVEASFSSKMLATIDPSKPIWDQYVLQNLGLELTGKTQDEKLHNEYVRRFDFYHCFETPNMHWLNQRLEPLGQTVCFMAEYYLPDLSKLTKLPCQYELRLLERADFEELYVPEWSNALCRDRKELDVLGVGAYDGGKLIGLAGCSADAEQMWQIGVDVLPEYRKKGIASAITSSLGLEILAREKVPFYCSAWSNIRSARNAIKSGFLPAWVEMTIKQISNVEKMNFVHK